MTPSVLQQLDESIATFTALREQTDAVERVVTVIKTALQSGCTLFTCGNGGSAADAIHLAEELVGRYRSNRPPLPAICLNADSGALTCISNDFGYEQIFARPLEALGKPGDVIVGFTTSGSSPNVLAAFRAARTKGIITVGLLGKDGGPALALCDHAIVIPSPNTARIQEVHGFLLHAICEALEP